MYRLYPVTYVVSPRSGLKYWVEIPPREPPTLGFLLPLLVRVCVGAASRAYRTVDHDERGSSEGK